MHHALLSAVLSLSVLFSPLVAAQAAEYTFTMFDVPDASRTLPNDINNFDQTVGFYESASGQHGFLYVDGMFTTLADFPGAAGRTVAWGLNNKGQIVGSYSFLSGGSHGFIYDYDNGEFTTLDVPFSGAYETFPVAINDDGQIAGIYQDTSGQHGFLYAAGVFTSLDMPGARTGSTVAWDLNNKGQIVGVYADQTPQSAGGPRAHGFLYANGVFTPLPDVPFPGAVNTAPTGINNHGQIVGTYNDLSGGRYGFLYDYDTGVFATLDVPGATSVDVTGLNDDGQIVGFYTDSSGGTHGFLATPVADTIPPAITVAASPATLSPPNGKLVPVTVSGTITDEPEGSVVEGAAYTVVDEYAQVQPSGNVTLEADGSYVCQRR
jgi:probable HAF family extracellular repeat protein